MSTSWISDSGISSLGGGSVLILASDRLGRGWCFFGLVVGVWKGRGYKAGVDVFCCCCGD